VATCPSGALSLADGRVRYDGAKCIKCDRCLAVCPNFSSPRCTEIDDKSLLKLIKKREDFIDGVTFSGGECTLQHGFVLDVFRGIKAQTKLTCFIDTNGYLEHSALEALCDVTDGFMFDVKAFDSEKHERLTGLPNGPVFDNLGVASSKGLLYEIRTVIAEGFTDDADEIRRIAAYVKELNDYTMLRLIPFRSFGVKGSMRGLAACSRETAVRLHGVASELLGSRVTVSSIELL
jgi:pyruvate formate lyase activating enzyme